MIAIAGPKSAVNFTFQATNRDRRPCGPAYAGNAVRIGWRILPSVAVDAFYEPVRPDTFAATAACAGPWDAGSQHAGPVSALLGRAFERHEPVPGQQLARVCVDIFRPVPVASLTLHVRTVRPGRRVTLLEAVAEADGQEVAQARGWRVLAPAEPTPATEEDPVPDRPEQAELSFWPGAHGTGYVAAMEWRFVTGAFTQPGPAQAWMRARVPLVAGEETSPFSRVLLVADSGNGVSGWLDPAQWLFINVDLTVALHRPPRGEWILLDAETTIGESGVGLTSSRLGDRDGRIGRGLQTLVITPRAR